MSLTGPFNRRCGTYQKVTPASPSTVVAPDDRTLHNA